jgi:hypothetical protein
VFHHKKPTLVGLTKEWEMKRWTNMVLCLLVMGLFIGCGGSKGTDSPTGPGDTGGQTIKTRTPEEARLELGTLGVQYDRGSFVKAVENSDTLVVILFLDAGMDPNTKDYNGYTAMMFAANSGQLESVKLLVEAGANVNAMSSDQGWTALMIAARGGYLNIVKILITAGADVNAARSDGATALYLARVNGHTEVADYLRSVGATE